MTRSRGLSMPRRAGHETGPGEAGRATLLVADAVSASVTVPLLVGPWGASLDAALGRRRARERAPRMPLGAVLQRQGAPPVRWPQHVRPGLPRVRHRGARRSPGCNGPLLGRIRADALLALTPAIVDGSARHGVAVSASLRNGVRDALAALAAGHAGLRRPRRRGSPDDSARIASTLDQAFTARLSRAVPAVRRVARARADVASRIPPQLHDRGAARTGRDARAPSAASGRRCRRCRAWRTPAATPARSS